MMKSCVCGRSKLFDKCCGRFLSGEMDAKTPEQLMRSRFSAYALGGYGEYLVSTWLPSPAQDLDAVELSEKTVDWKRLRIISSSQKGDKGIVEFKAWFSASPGSEEVEVMHEVSRFVRIQSRWFYVGGTVKYSHST